MSLHFKRKKLSDENIKHLMMLKQEDLTIEKIRDLFAFDKDGKQMMDPTDEFILEKGKLYNDRDIATTAGRYIFNLIILTPNMGSKIGYVNVALTSGEQDNLNSKVNDLLLKDEITVEEYIEYIDKLAWMGYGLNSFLVQGLSLEIFDPIPEVIQRRDELFEKHKEALENGDVVVATQIEKELVALAQDKAKTLNGYEVFESGAGKKFSNNYKQVSILRGPVPKFGYSGFNVSKDNLADGIPKEDYHIYAGMPVPGSYNRGVGTEQGGYLKKVLEASFQTEVQGEPGSDCGSKGYLEVELTKGNISSFRDRYIIEGQKLVRLTTENSDQYVNKKVKMRSPLFCVDEKYCSKCMGEHFHNMGIKNVGMITTAVGSSIMNSSMKSFHDSTIKIYTPKIEDYIQEI